MSEHKATIRWALADSRYSADDFKRGKFSREHQWSFDGGLSFAGSAAPSVVPAPYSNPANVDPEEAFVASLSSCHMLTFLFVASRKGFAIESYEDEAVGSLSKKEANISWISRVELRPRIVFAGERQPTPEELAQLHHDAHKFCFIANSVTTEVVVAEPATALLA
ncbi:MAG TPA: OsmC family protein [Polyangia bacterium]